MTQHPFPAGANIQTHRPSLFQLANLSARGQEFLRKQGGLGGKIDMANRTAGEETFQQSFLGAASTIASQDFPGDATRYNSMCK